MSCVSKQWAFTLETDVFFKFNFLNFYILETGPCILLKLARVALYKEYLVYQEINSFGWYNNAVKN